MDHQEHGDVHHDALNQQRKLVAFGKPVNEKLGNWEIRKSLAAQFTKKTTSEMNKKKAESDGERFNKINKRKELIFYDTTSMSVPQPQFHCKAV